MSCHIFKWEIRSSCGSSILMPCLIIYSEVLLAEETFLRMKLVKEGRATYICFCFHHSAPGGELYQTEQKQLRAILTLPCFLQTKLVETNSANWIIDITLINQHPNQPVGWSLKVCSSNMRSLFFQVQSCAATPAAPPPPCYFHFCHLLSYLSCCY